jgi:hypothetical protein
MVFWLEGPWELAFIRKNILPAAPDISADFSKKV